MLTHILHLSIKDEISVINKTTNEPYNLSSKERYCRIIKPISLIFCIYENMINGNYLQFFSIISMDVNFASEIVSDLIELSFILNIEEIVSYKNKFNSYFNVVYYLFSDLHVFMKSENNLANLDKFFLLTFDGIDSCNISFSLISFKIIFYFCKNFIDLRNTYKANQHEINNSLGNYFLFVYENFISKFILFFEKIMKMLMQNNICNKDELSQALLGLIVLFWENYNESVICLIDKLRENEERKKL